MFFFVKKKWAMPVRKMCLADLNEHCIFFYQNLDLKELSQLTVILSASWLFDSLVSVFGTITPSEGRKNQEFTFAGIVVLHYFAEV